MNYYITWSIAQLVGIVMLISGSPANIWEKSFWGWQLAVNLFGMLCCFIIEMVKNKNGD